MLVGVILAMIVPLRPGRGAGSAATPTRQPPLDRPNPAAGGAGTEVTSNGQGPFGR
jgi:hypothetical protein